LLWRALTATVSATALASASAITAIAAAAALPVATTIATVAATAVTSVLGLFVACLGDESFIVLVGGSSGTTTPIATTSAVAASPVVVITAAVTSTTSPVVPSSGLRVGSGLVVILIVLAFLDLLGVGFFGFLLLIVLHVLLSLSGGILGLFLFGGLNLHCGLLGSLLSFCLLSALSKLFVRNSLVSLSKKRGVSQRILDKSSELSEVHASGNFAWRSGDKACEGVGEAWDLAGVLEGGNTVVLEDTFKGVDDNLDSFFLGVSKLNVWAVSVNELMDRIDLANQSECSDEAVLHILFSKLGTRGLDSVVGVALDVEVDLLLEVLDLGFEGGTSLDLVHEVLVRLELLILELGLIGDNLVNLLLLVADLLGLGAQEKVLGVDKTIVQGHLLFGELLLLLDTHLN
jgi:hypothetical protein